MRIVLKSESEAATIELAKKLGRRLRAADVICLYGPLGAGKTCFVRGLASGLGLEEAAVSSPSFLICHEYNGRGDLRLTHLDAYRLAGSDELQSIGWDELCAAHHTVIAIEWASRIEPALPQERIDVTLDHTAANSRRITIDAPDSLVSRLEGLDV